MGISGIILAGGESRRMGKDKGLLYFQGKKLVEHAIDFLSPWCTDLLLSANNAKYEQFGLPVISDIFVKTGPIGGIFSSLEVSKNDSNLVLACDITEIPDDLPGVLLFHSPGYQAVVPVHPDGKAEPLCAWYHKDLRHSMKLSIEKGNYKLIDFLRQAHTCFLPLKETIKDYHSHILHNLNSPEDLKIS